jgi:hypothetical protein
MKTARYQEILWLREISGWRMTTMVKFYEIDCDLLQKFLRFSKEDFWVVLMSWSFEGIEHNDAVFKEEFRKEHWKSVLPNFEENSKEKLGKQILFKKFLICGSG